MIIRQMAGVWVSVVCLSGCSGDRGATGDAGQGCTVTTNDDGAATITCADGSTSVVGQKAPPTREDFSQHSKILPYDVQTAFNDDTIFFRVRFASNRGVRTKFFRFHDGKWKSEGEALRDTAANLLDPPDTRQAFITDGSTGEEVDTAITVHDPSDPRTRNFDKVGCFLACHNRSLQMPDWDSSKGPTSMFVRYDDAATNWWESPPTGAGASPGGRALDFMHWRARRAEPIGYAMDLWFRTTRDTDNDSSNPFYGRPQDFGTPTFDNTATVDGGTGTCAGSGAALCVSHVFDPSTTDGNFAFVWDDYWTTPYYYATNASAWDLGVAAPHPALMEWGAATAAGYVPKEGDTVPGTYLRQPTDSAADIISNGTRFIPSAGDSEFGTWEIQFQRKLNTGHTAAETGYTDDDVEFRPDQFYDVAFAAHAWNYQWRDHYVSFSQKIYLAKESSAPELCAEAAPPTSGCTDIIAPYVAGAGGSVLPNWSSIASKRLYLFQPGITSWEFLVGELTNQSYYDPATGDPIHVDHPGADEIRDERNGCRDCHVERNEDWTDRPDDPDHNGGSMETRTSTRGGVFSLTPVPPQ